MMETSFFLDEDKNIFAFKGKISEGDVSLSTENSEHQKKYSCDSKQLFQTTARLKKQAFHLFLVGDPLLFQKILS